MRNDANRIKMGLTSIANQSPSTLASSAKAVRYRETALEALAYIRQLEGDLRRAGFTEYNDPKETEE